MQSWNRLRSRPRLMCSTLVIRGLNSLGGASPLAWLVSKFIRPIDKCPSIKKSGAYTVLVLDAQRFRGELELYLKSPDLRFLSINWEFLRSLLLSFVDQGWIEERDRRLPYVMTHREVFHSATLDSDTGRQRERYRKRLRSFLPILFDGLGVDVVMTSDLRFRRQSDFCQVASELGYPYILFQRESMFMMPNVFDLVSNRHKLIGSFWGDAVAVQNQITKEMFLASGNYDEKRIVVAGCARMDSLIAKIGAARPSPTKTITIFAWPWVVVTPGGLGFAKLGDAMPPTVRAAARVARCHPEVQVKIKLKDFWKTDHHQRKLQAYKDVLIDELGEIPANIEFVMDRMAAHDLVLRSTVVVAMQSTVALEAAIAGKPVILPHFKFVREDPEAKRNMMYLDDHALFDVPDDEVQLESMLLERLENPEVPEPVMKARREVFARHVSPLDGSATERGSALICRWADIGRRRRRQRNQDSVCVRSANRHSDGTTSPGARAKHQNI